MKIIDLLNKIENGEEVPKKIKLNDTIFVYQGDDYLYEDKDGNECWLFNENYTNRYNWLECFLRDEVEIIEEDKKEDKKIEKIKLVCCYSDLIDRNDFVIKYLAELKYKINEIIDYINKEKE